MDKWIPINKKFSAVDLNSSAVIGNDKIFAVGEYGAIKVTDLYGNFEMLRGNFALPNLNDITYDGNSILMAVGDNSSLVISKDNGLNWSDVNVEIIDNFKSVAYFYNSFFVSSENAIYEFNPNISQFRLITDEYSGINKLHSTSDYLYAIGQHGLLLQYFDFEFKQLSINTTENISEKISRENKIIIFPNKEYAIFTENNFSTTSRFSTENNLFFIKSAAWIDDDLIIGIGSRNNLPPYNHAYSDNLLQSWNSGSYPWPPQRSLKGFGDFAIITAEQGAIIFITNSQAFSPDFYMFNFFLTLEKENIFFSRLSLKGNKAFAFGYNYNNLQIDINSLKVEPYLSKIDGINDAIFYNNKYYILKSWEKLENGRKYYINYVLKLSDNNIDTVLSDDDYIVFKYTNIEEIHDKLLIYGKTNKMYLKNSDDDVFEEIKLSGYIQDLIIYENIIYIILMNNQYKTYLVKSTDFGETFEEILFFDNLNKISIYKDKIYLLTTSYGTGLTRFHTVYKYSAIPEKIYEFTSQAPIIRFHVYNDLILLVDSDNTFFSTDAGNTWSHESFGYVGGSIYGVVAYENKAFMSKGNFIYYRLFDLATSVWEPFQDKANSIRIFPNPATDYIYINFDDESVFGGVKIFNILGECVSHLTPTLSKEEGVRMVVSHLPPGVYFVRIGSRAEKFVKW